MISLEYKISKYINLFISRYASLIIKVLKCKLNINMFIYNILAFNRRVLENFCIDGFSNIIWIQKFKNIVYLLKFILMRF